MKELRFLAALVALALPGPLLAQSAQPDPPRRLDGEVAYLTFSWVRPVFGRWALGSEVGAGVLEQKTVSPREDDFTAILHVGLVSPARLSESLRAELGFRLGLGELRSTACSGCFPDVFGAGTVALFTGFRRLRLGTRLMVGRAGGEAFGAWSPLVLRLRF